MRRRRRDLSQLSAPDGAGVEIRSMNVGVPACQQKSFRAVGLASGRSAYVVRLGYGVSSMRQRRDIPLYKIEVGG